MLLDHLVISCESLDEGADFVGRRLGVAPVSGGRHDYMGTHNLLLSLGPDAYLEVIAIDPDAEAPRHPRWFGLDRFCEPPRLTNWVMRCNDLDAALAGTPMSDARIAALSRGDLHWRMAVTADGRLPFDGLFPGLIEWQGGVHPAPRLPDHGLRLEVLELAHPRAAALAAALGKQPQVSVGRGAPGIGARIRVAGGDIRHL